MEPKSTALNPKRPLLFPIRPKRSFLIDSLLNSDSNSESENGPTQAAVTTQSNVAANVEQQLLTPPVPIIIVPTIEESFISSLSRAERSRLHSRLGLELGSRSRGNRHSPEVVCKLKRWFVAHKNKPYPNVDEKSELCMSTGLDRQQIDDWFANARRTYKNGHTNYHNRDNPCNMDCQFLLNFNF